MAPKDIIRSPCIQGCDLTVNEVGENLGEHGSNPNRDKKCLVISSHMLGRLTYLIFFT